MRLLTALLTTALLGVGLALPSTPAAAASFVLFTDPSRSVFCSAVRDDEGPDRLRCDVVDGSSPLPLPPAHPSCTSEWATTVRMQEGTLARWGGCVGDSLANDNVLGKGETLTMGVYRCAGLATGVRCRDTSTRYGFTLTPENLRFLRPRAAKRITPHGVGKLRIGMTKARAKRTGQITAGPCGQPQPKGNWGVWLSWNGGRLHDVLANSHTRSQTTRGVGVGSRLSALRKQYRGTLTTAYDQVEGADAHLYVVTRKRNKLVFILDEPVSAKPHATTLVYALWIVRAWKPSQGFGFSGC